MASLSLRQPSQQPQTAASGSQTATVAGPSSAAPPTSSEPAAADQAPQPILRLRGSHGRNRRGVQWAEGVVDNEGLNRKKSKVCCIYHRPRNVDESSDSSSSDSSSDSSSSDDDSDGGRAARSDADRAFRGPSGGGRRPARHRHAPDCPEHGHGHDRDHGHDQDHDHESGSSGDDERDGGDGGRGRKETDKGKGKAKDKGKRRPSPNAYEKMPRYDKPPKLGS